MAAWHCSSHLQEVVGWLAAIHKNTSRAKRQHTCVWGVWCAWFVCVGGGGEKEAGRRGGREGRRREGGRERREGGGGGCGGGGWVGGCVRGWMCVVVDV